jgi:radical SAM superfamily enzyme YgiQ (UPF0313 family)
MKHALSFIHKKASTEPLGLLTVAALLPQEWGKRLIDLNVAPVHDRDLAWADYVMISAMTVQRESARRIIARCKSAGVKVIAGGPLFTSEFEQFEDVSYFVLNEAEITLPLFLMDLGKGHPKRVYRTSEFPDIRNTPAPLWDLIQLKHYASISIQYSRGCPFNCDFCNITSLFGHLPRVKTTEQILRELNGIYERGWRESVFFVDDNLMGNKKHLKQELLPALIEWRKGKKGMPFNTEISMNLADDDELLQMLVQAGFDTVFIGVETIDEAGLVECNKKQNLNRDLVADVRRIQHAGLQVQGGFIVGFDSDTPSTFQHQIEFIQKSGIVTAMLGLLQAPPGTQLYNRMKAEGRLIGSLTGDNADGTTNIIPLMSREKLQEGYQSALKYLYAPKNYYARVKTLLKEYKAPKISIPIRMEYIRAFFRSVIRLGILGKERIQYWKLVVWTLFRRPRLFPLAITLSIYGYHFRRVCDLHVA